MIASITKGHGFKSLFEYLLKKEKGAIILTDAKNCLAETPAKLAAEFELIAAKSPRTEKPVRHFSIGFSEKDGVVSNETKSLAAMQIIKAMGYENCQYFTVAHSRNDKSHPKSHNHDHMHIVTNAIDLNGNRIDDFWDYRKMELALRKIEKDLELDRIACSWQKSMNKEEADIEKAINPDIKSILAQFENTPTLPEWIKKLEESSINLKFKLTREGKTQGVSYLYKGELYKGGEIGFSLPKMREKIPVCEGDLIAMRDANTRSDSLPLANHRERDKANKLVLELALKSLNGDCKLDRNRVKITLSDDGIININRTRVGKNILTAQQSGNEWIVLKSNVDKQDINVLAKIVADLERKNLNRDRPKFPKVVLANSKIEPIPQPPLKTQRESVVDRVEIEVVQVAKTSEVSKQSRQMKPRKRSNELG